MKQLFTVTLKLKVVVAAESREEAAKVASENWNEVISSAFQSESDWNVTEEGRWWLPDYWELENIPYGSDTKTIGDYIKEKRP